MNNLYLGGGGGAEDSRTLDAAFVASLPPDPKLLYIPIAMDEKDHSYPSCLEWLRLAVGPLGVLNIEMWTDLRGKTAESLAAFDAVYVGGGNTFKLLKEMSDSGFGSMLAQYAERGGAVYGGSAGAIVLGTDIGTCAHMDENAVGLKRTTALGLLGKHSVWCHYVPSNDPLIREYVTRTGFPVVALTERGGLCVKGGQIEVIGDSAMLFAEGNQNVVPIGGTIKIQ